MAESWGLLSCNTKLMSYAAEQRMAQELGFLPKNNAQSKTGKQIFRIVAYLSPIWFVRFCSNHISFLRIWASSRILSYGINCIKSAFESDTTSGNSARTSW